MPRRTLPKGMATVPDPAVTSPPLIHCSGRQNPSPSSRGLTEGKSAAEIARFGSIASIPAPMPRPIHQPLVVIVYFLLSSTTCLWSLRSSRFGVGSRDVKNCGMMSRTQALEFSLPLLSFTGCLRDEREGNYQGCV